MGLCDGQKNTLPPFPRLHPAHRHCVKANGMMLAKREREDEVLELPESPEPGRARGGGGTVLEPGPSKARTREARRNRKMDVINLEEVVLVADQRDLLDQREHNSQPRLAPNRVGTIECIRENSRLDHTYFQPVDKDARALTDHCLSPRQAQGEIKVGLLPRDYPELIPGPSFPRPEPEQVCISGLPSPQLTPPAEEQEVLQGAINEQAGPAFPVQGSLESASGAVPKQGSPRFDKPLTALLIRETVSGLLCH